MKTVRLHKPRELQVHDEPMPEVKNGEVLLRVVSVGVCGSDVHWYESGHIGDLYVKEPLILGHEIGAVVEEIGPGVKGLTVGQIVAVEPANHCGHCEYCLAGNPNLCRQMPFCGTPPTDGGFCEYMAWPAELCFPLPSNVTPDEAALIEPLAVGVFAADLGHIRLGDKIAVFGCGCIGLCTLQSAKVAGAMEIYAVDPLDNRLDLAKQCGATEVINPKKKDAVEKILDLTKGGVDVVFEATKDSAVAEQCMRATRPGGSVVLIGIPRTEPMSFDTNITRRKGLTVRFVRRSKHACRRSIDLLERKLVSLQPMVSHSFPLEETGRAFRMLEEYDDGIIKAVIRCGE